MNLVDVTPIMTSDTTPSPYVVSASGYFSESYKPFRAFDNAKPNGYFDDYWAVNDRNGWIMIDLAKNTFASHIQITSRNHFSSLYVSPSAFNVEGSVDNKTWDKLLEVQNEPAWNIWETREYVLEKTGSYRYYKVNILDVFGMTDGAWYCGVGEIRFLSDELIKDPGVSHTKAFHAQTLPMNTTKKILSKYGDSREGLLGMANDPDNYGDLYVVGRDGRSHLTKSGTKSEVIFDGNANTKGQKYNVTKCMFDYKYLSILGDTGDDVSYNCMIGLLVSVDYIKNITTPKDILLATNNRWIAIKLSDDGMSFTVSSLENVLGTKCSVNRIEGIY